MKVYVRIQDRWFAIVCSNETGSIKWLVEEAFRRARLHSPQKEFDDAEVCLTNSDGLIVYHNDDKIRDVLKDEQFVAVTYCKNNTDALSPPLPLHAFDHLSLKEEQAKIVIVLDGRSLTTEILCKLSTDKYRIEVSKNAMSKVKASRDVIEDIIKEKRVVYGINTGFGSFARTHIGEDDLEELQRNLIVSHACGVGDPLSPSRVRMMMAVRINVLCKGYSGISPKNLQLMVDAYNESCLPYVPEKGTVGASGDLAPLAHIALGLMGEGSMWSPSSGWADASMVLKSHGVEPMKLLPKEGLALVNGTQFISALGAEAVERANLIALQADVVAALTIEALRGTARAFDERIHDARPHKGQIQVAKRLRTLLQYNGQRSDITESHKTCDRVQDSYTLRCCPQVHGIAHDTIDFVRNTLNVELNSATDNPMIMTDQREALSGGNFHGEYPAKVLDYLAIAIHEISSMSERRIERLCNHSLSELPAFLVKKGGLNSGFMIAHVTASSLVSENKGLCHPSSVDSLSTSAAQEDHVSMGGWAARKAIQVVEHVEHVVAIELLCACQAIDFHRPMQSTTALEQVHKVVRNCVPHYEKDRIMYTDIETVTGLLRNGDIWKAVAPYLD